MAIDPKAAAAAAQAAAAAAQAGAEAAAAAAAQATTNTAPTLATSTTREVLGDTGVTLGTELGGDAAALAEIGQEESALGGGERSGLMDLPGLESALDRAGASALSGAAGMLDLTFADSSPAIGKSMIADGALTAAVGSTDFYRDAGTSDAGTPGGDQDAGSQGGWMGDIGGKGFLGLQGTKTRYRYDDETGEVTEESTDAGTSGEDTTTSAEATANAEKIEGGAVKDTGGEPWYSKAWNAIFGDDDDADTSTDGTDGGTTGGADAGGGSDVPAEDAPFNPPPGWVDPDVLGRGVGGAVIGSKGGSDDGEVLRPGSYGDDTVINYGSEGGPINVEGGPLRDLTAANWVGQPVPDANAVPLDQAKLEELSVLPDDEVINPGGGEQADASTQASTAYQGMASSAGAAGAPAGTLPATDDAAVGDTASNGAAAPDEAPAFDDAGTAMPDSASDPGMGMPTFDSDDDAADAGPGRGRDFGQDQGQGRGHGPHDNQGDDPGE